MTEKKNFEGAFEELRELCGLPDFGCPKSREELLAQVSALCRERDMQRADIGELRCTVDTLLRERKALQEELRGRGTEEKSCESCALRFYGIRDGRCPCWECKDYSAWQSRKEGSEKVRIYIAGKITGDKDFRDKFRDAAEKLMDWHQGGAVILNPAELPGGLDKREYMRLCFAMVEIADIVYLLEDWQQSEGAKLEKAYCDYIGKGTVEWKG